MARSVDHVSVIDDDDDDVRQTPLRTQRAASVVNFRSRRATRHVTIPQADVDIVVITGDGPAHTSYTDPERTKPPLNDVGLNGRRAALQQIHRKLQNCVDAATITESKLDVSECASSYNSLTEPAIFYLRLITGFSVSVSCRSARCS